MNHLENVLLVSNLTVWNGIHWLDLARRSCMLALTVKTPAVAAVTKIVVRLVSTEVRVSRSARYPIIRASTV